MSNEDIEKSVISYACKKCFYCVYAMNQSDNIYPNANFNLMCTHPKTYMDKSSTRNTKSIDLQLVATCKLTNMYRHVMKPHGKTAINIHHK